MTGRVVTLRGPPAPAARRTLVAASAAILALSCGTAHADPAPDPARAGDDPYAGTHFILLIDDSGSMVGKSARRAGSLAVEPLVKGVPAVIAGGVRDAKGVSLVPAYDAATD